MNLFLARISLRTSQYMSDQSVTQPVVRLVRADNEEDARRKVESHYESLSYTYGTIYVAVDIELSGVIE